MLFPSFPCPSYIYLHSFCHSWLLYVLWRIYMISPLVWCLKKLLLVCFINGRGKRCWMWIWYTWHYLAGRLLKLTEVIGSMFAYLTVFCLSVKQISIWKLSLVAFSSSQSGESLHPNSRLIIPMAKDFRTWKKNRKKKKRERETGCS